MVVAIRGSKNPIQATGRRRITELFRNLVRKEKLRRLAQDRMKSRKLLGVR